MKYFSSFILLLTVTDICFTQAPAIEMQNTISGTSPDWIKSIDQTSDGGYIIGGESSSGVGEDKTTNNKGGRDYWIVKLKASGGIKWQKVYGGNLDDDLVSIVQTSDGGYLVGGISSSGISGNKTETNLGGTDFWVLKLDPMGNLIWQNTIGGNDNDYLTELIETSDGGCAIISQSESGISGDKTEPVITDGTGGYDYWIVKLDNAGNIIWQNTIGGNYGDIGTSIDQTSDGGYIVGGVSLSGATGDKTEANFGGWDFWILKLNNTGAIVWQNTIGGDDGDFNCTIKQTPDGGYILGGTSYSLVSFDKTESSHWSDYWILKLNSEGNIIWQNTIGASNYDDFDDLAITSDGGYLLGGTSWSNAGYDKSEDRLGDDPDAPDCWVVKINNTGTIIWENTIGGFGGDYLYGGVKQTTDNGYILGATSDSPVSGDKTGPGSSYDPDYWFIKLFNDPCVPAIELCNNIDDNCNGIIDDGIVETISISADGPTSFCKPGSVNLNAVYSGSSLQWKKDGVNIVGATTSTYSATTTGNYTCVTTSACGSAESTGILVISNKKPSAIITAGGATSFCAGGSVVLTANAGVDLNYQWFNGAVPIVGATSINYTATIAGNYKCTVTKTTTGCYKNSNSILVAVPCRNGELNSGELIVYPNPASNEIIISVGALITPHSSLIITDLAGKIIYQNELTAEETIINVSDYASGIYFVQLNINGEFISDKFIKQ